MTAMKPKTDRAMKLLGSFDAVVPDVIESMMRESGMAGSSLPGLAAGIRTQVDSYRLSFSHGVHALAPQEAESVRVLMMALVAAAKERQLGLSPYGDLN
jgi:hypothetical protein